MALHSIYKDNRFEVQMHIITDQLYCPDKKIKLGSHHRHKFTR